MIFYNLGVDVDSENNINLKLSEVNLSKVLGFKIFFRSLKLDSLLRSLFFAALLTSSFYLTVSVFYQISFYGGFYSLLQIFGTWISFYDALTNCFYSNLVFFCTYRISFYRF